MSTVKNRPGWWVSVSAAALLGCLSSGCASGNPSGGGYYLDDGPGKPDPQRVARLMREPDPVPKHEPLLARANRPYRVMGQDFAPMTERKPYKQQGVASWYGQRFHGKPTSTGETYDMYQMTAAHPTLPLPSYARVTRLDNGRSVVVRVNDRGPFLRGRLIDLSYLAASKLGYVGQGHAKVEVELLNPADAAKGRTLTAQPAGKAAPAQARTLPAVSLARAELDLPGDEGAPADKELVSAEAPRADERAGVAGGNNRQTLTDADAEGRRLFQSWCEAAGMSMALDRMGNMFMRLEGADPDADPDPHADPHTDAGRQCRSLL